MEHTVLNPEVGRQILEGIKSKDTGGQFIIVHGSSFRRALDAYHVDRINYPGLFGFLVNKVGKKIPCVREPIMVAPVNLSPRIQDIARDAGFSVWLARDLHVEMEGLLQTMDTTVTSITMLSNEISDRALEILSEYARSGVKVHFVGTTAGDRDSDQVSEKILAAVSSLPNLDFIDISTAIDDIALTFRQSAVPVVRARPTEPTHTPTQGKTFILINGASFAHAMELHNIGIPYYDVLYQILTKEIGTTGEHVARPIMIGSLRLHARTQEEIRAAGFELVMSSEEKRAGDWMLEKIQEQNPQVVSQLVVVANTLSYLREALLEKEKAGMDIYIVSTRSRDEKRGGPMLDPEDDFMISAKAHMHFVEIGQYAARLMKVPWQGTNGITPNVAHSRSQKQTCTLTLTFDIPPEANVRDVEHSLARSVGNFLGREGIQGGKYSIQSTD